MHARTDHPQPDNSDPTGPTPRVSSPDPCPNARGATRPPWRRRLLAGTSGVLAMAVIAAALVLDSPFHQGQPPGGGHQDPAGGWAVGGHAAEPGPASRLLPARTLVGYWQNFVNGAPPLRLAEVPRVYDLVAVGFAVADPERPGAVAFRVSPELSAALGGYTASDLRGDVEVLRSRGARVVLSVGGAASPVTVASPAEAEAFTNSVHGIMVEFGFDGVDIDLEHGIDPVTMAGALRALHSRVGDQFLITLAPETAAVRSAAAPYLRLALLVRDILAVVHTQYYNSGSMIGCDGVEYHPGTVDFVTSQVCTAIRSGLRPDQVALGFPASGRAAGSGYVPPETVHAAVECLTRRVSCGRFRPPQAWPTLRGLMVWSVNWDVGAGSVLSTRARASLGPAR